MKQLFRKARAAFVPVAIAGGIFASAALAAGTYHTGCDAGSQPANGTAYSYCNQISISPVLPNSIKSLDLRGLHSYSQYKFLVQAWDKNGNYLRNYGGWVRHGTPAYGLNYGPVFRIPDNDVYTVVFYTWNDASSADNYESWISQSTTDVPSP